jgi:hypothetical protein
MAGRGRGSKRLTAGGPPREVEHVDLARRPLWAGRAPGACDFWALPARRPRCYCEAVL